MKPELLAFCNDTFLSCPPDYSGWLFVWLCVYAARSPPSHVCFAESKAGFSDETDAADTGLSRESSSGIALSSQILTALKEKPAPELSLSSQDLEVGKSQGP